MWIYTPPAFARGKFVVLFTEVWCWPVRRFVAASRWSRPQPYGFLGFQVLGCLAVTRPSGRVDRTWRAYEEYLAQIPMLLGERSGVVIVHGMPNPPFQRLRSRPKRRQCKRADERLSLSDCARGWPNASQIAEQAKRIEDLERQLALRHQNSTAT
jgi:hypothetical protein